MMYDMTIGVLFRQAYSCGPAYAGVALGTVSLYSVFTLAVTQWRTQFRVNMNKVTLVIQATWDCRQSLGDALRNISSWTRPKRSVFAPSTGVAGVNQGTPRLLILNGFRHRVL